MKKLFTFMLLLLSILTGSSWGATRYFGTPDAPADTTGKTATWSATFTACLTAASSGDSLQQVGNSDETLTSAYSCANKALKINGETGKTVIADSFKVSFSGTGALAFTNLNLTAAFYTSKTTAFTWSGGSLKHPGANTEVATTGYGIGIYARDLTFTNVTMGPCGVTSGDSGEMLFSGGAGAMVAVLSGCTFAQDDVVHFGNATSGYARLLSCTFSGSTAESASWMAFIATANLDSVAVDGCTYVNPVNANTGWEFNDQIAIRLNENTCSTWGPHGVTSKNPLWYVKASTDASRPKTVLVTDNIVRRTADTAAGSRAWIYGVDKDVGTRLTMTGNLIDSTFAAELDYVLYWPVYGDSTVIEDNTVYAGVFYLGAPAAADRNPADIGVGWRFADNVIDHSEWAPTTPPSTALTWCPSYSTISGNTIKSDRCNHLILLNDDVAPEWRAADSTAASYNVLTLNTFDQGPFTGTFAVTVADKGRRNLGYNNTFIQRGSTDVYSYCWSVSGDSSTCYNNDVTITDAGAGTNSVFNDALYVLQSTENAYHNNLVRGTADYVFTSSSGDGSGWTESNNCWAIAYGTRFDADGDSMATTSFTDSTSWHMKWGGKTGLTGITASTFGTVAVGANVNPASYGVPTIGQRNGNIPGHWWVLYNINNNGWPASEDSLEDKDDWYQIMKPVSPSDNVQYRLWLDEYYKLDKSDQKILWKVEGVSSGMATYYGHYRWLDSLTSHGASLGDSLDDATWQPIPKPLNMSDELQLYIFRKAYFQLPDTTRKKMFWKVLAQATNFKDWDGYWPILDAIPGTFAASDEYDPSTWFTIPKPRNKSDEEMLSYYMDEYFLLPDATRDKMYWKINQ